MKRLALCAAAVLLAACDDFSKDLSNWCFQHPDACGNDGGTGGSAAGGGGGAANGGGTTAGGGSAGGGSGACGDFGTPCTGEGQCCATTKIGGTDYPLACTRLGFCEIIGTDCRESLTSCSDAGQCCTQRCTAGHCDACAQDNAPCDSPYNCCAGFVCGNDSLCHAAGVGSTTGPVGGACKSSSDCRLGWCEKDGGTSGFCSDPSTHSCQGLMQDQPPMCCSGLNYDSSFNQCCQPDGEWCDSDFDCCGTGCYGGICGTRPANGVPLGGRCSLGNDCAATTGGCDPIAYVCVDRWCFNAFENAFNGCCVMTGTTCTFDGGTQCGLFGAVPSSPSKCCSGVLEMGQNYCSDPKFSD